MKVAGEASSKVQKGAWQAVQTAGTAECSLSSRIAGSSMLLVGNALGQRFQAKKNNSAPSGARTASSGSALAGNAGHKP